ncbi:MAG: transposase [Flavobacteriales bacterium]|nr:transposase [Flavobacteriales bacterium]
MDAHLDQEKKRSNRRNGYTDKTVRTALGPVSVRPPRDRNGSLSRRSSRSGTGRWPRTGEPDPHLYGKGTSYEDIGDHLKKMYRVGYPIVHQLTWRRVFEESETWRNRPLEEVYVVIYRCGPLQGRENRKVLTKAVYSVYGVRMDGERDVLGLFIGDAEGHAIGRVLENIKDAG